MNEERFHRIIRDMTIHHPRVIRFSDDLFSIHFAITYTYPIYGQDYQNSDCGYIMRCKKIGSQWSFSLHRENGSCVFHHRGGCYSLDCHLTLCHMKTLFNTLIEHPKLRLKWMLLTK